VRNAFLFSNYQSFKIRLLKFYSKFVALSSSKLVELCAVAAVVLVQSDVEDVVSLSFCQERVTFEELSDDDAVGQNRCIASSLLQPG